jgi:uncharacterized protein YukE
MALEGMDTGLVIQLSQRLRVSADEIDAIVHSIDGLIAQLEQNWHGKDATEFASWWNTQHRPSLMRTEEAIRGLGQSAFNNAQAQINASNS